MVYEKVSFALCLTVRLSFAFFSPSEYTLNYLHCQHSQHIYLLSLYSFDHSLYIILCECLFALSSLFLLVDFHSTYCQGLHSFVVLLLWSWHPIWPRKRWLELNKIKNFRFQHKIEHFYFYFIPDTSTKTKFVFFQLVYLFLLLNIFCTSILLLFYLLSIILFHIFSLRYFIYLYYIYSYYILYGICILYICLLYYFWPHGFTMV